MSVAGATVQERFETRRSGRAVISAFLLVTLAAVVVTNLPESRMRHEAMHVAGPYLDATGMDQDWRVFAPEPRRASIDLSARVAYADGHVATWRPPAGGDLLGAAWDYRWLKWVENAMQDARRDVLWKPAALFVADEMARPGTHATSVTLVRRWRDLPPPGARRTAAPPWKSYAFYELPLGKRGGAR
jgi:hypothetical protein